jgi:hypothetical protein
MSQSDSPTCTGHYSGSGGIDERRPGLQRRETDGLAQLPRRVKEEQLLHLIRCPEGRRIEEAEEGGG